MCSLSEQVSQFECLVNTYIYTLEDKHPSAVDHNFANFFLCILVVSFSHHIGLSYIFVYFFSFWFLGFNSNNFSHLFFASSTAGCSAANV